MLTVVEIINVELEVEPALVLVLELLAADVAPSDVPMEGVDEVPWTIVLVVVVVGLLIVELACKVNGSVLATDKVEIVVVRMLLVLVTTDDAPCDALTKVFDDIS